MKEGVYQAGIYCYQKVIQLASVLGNPKAKLWIEGRKNWLLKLQSAREDDQRPCFWMHCSSLGEFEQGRPVIELFHTLFPDWMIVLTFYSPSGYEIRKNYNGADYICYLPLDTPQNAKEFVQTLKPDIVVFVKYELWYYLLSQCIEHKIPVYLISAIFRDNNSYVNGFLSSLFLKILHGMKHIFVQNQQSFDLLQNAGIQQISFSGDTRFDRVCEIVKIPVEMPDIELFIDQKPCLVAGSTWQEDEKVILDATRQISQQFKLIIAPHEIHPEVLYKRVRQNPDEILYSQWIQNPINPEKYRILWIDNIGMLNKLYRFADICYVGGGFGKGIHNVLEAAVYSKRTIWGPNDSKFEEAQGLKKAGGGACIHHAQELAAELKNMLNQTPDFLTSCQKAGDFVFENKGATAQIVEKICADLQQK